MQIRNKILSMTVTCAGLEKNLECREIFQIDVVLRISAFAYTEKHYFSKTQKTPSSEFNFTIVHKFSCRHFKKLHFFNIEFY